ncbi:MAG: TIGR03915 family putative DNA repair protein [Leadbetterella sp.]|nr:TIGR03915 family putative DNA repair protein [Leadbetterella sp.]
MSYLFDGTYAGFLCCVFDSFARKEPEAIPLLSGDQSADLFKAQRTVITDVESAKRVQKGLEKHLGAVAVRDFYRVFLSEDRKAWLAAFRVISRVFTAGPDILQNFGDDDVICFSLTLKKVHRERHRMKAFIRFQKSSDGLFFSIVEPDFDVLPLIADFFRERYADQPWLIWDNKRKYGLLYDQITVSPVQLSPEEKMALTTGVTLTLDERDEHFQHLWKQYFQSTNIEARRNMKLHLRHVPKRYWKYLPEKQ